MRERHKYLGQIFFIYGVAFLSPMASIALSYIRGEGIGQCNFGLAILSALAGIAMHIIGYVLLRIKSKS